MISVALAVILLAAAASYGSWQFSQWIGTRQRAPVTVLALCGIVLLTGLALLTVITATSWWKPLASIEDLSAPLIAPARSVQGDGHAPASTEVLSEPGGPDESAARVDAESQFEAAVAADLALLSASRSGGDQHRARVHQDITQDYPEPSGATPRATVEPRADASSDTASVVTSSSGAGVADPLLKDWPATECVKSGRTQDDDVGRRFIDNECRQVVAVIFAWCQQTQSVCTPNALISQGWRYEPAGILMTSLTQRPSSLRLGENGPLVAATYVLNQPGDQRRRVRYLACYVTAPGVLRILDASNDATSPENQRRQLEATLSADDCYSRVVQLSRAGQREGKSPDALLRDGV